MPAQRAVGAVSVRRATAVGGLVLLLLTTAVPARGDRRGPPEVLPARGNTASPPTAVLALWPDAPHDNLVTPRSTSGDAEPHDRILRFLETRPGMSVGLYSALQGRYDAGQVLIDVSQGGRQPTALYSSPVPSLGLAATERGGAFLNWPEVRRRARAVASTLRPGLLASSIPGGAGFASVDGAESRTAVPAADEGGVVAKVSSGPVATLARRVQHLSGETRFVVAALPDGRDGQAVIDELLASRRRDQLVIVLHVPSKSGPMAADADSDRFFRIPAIGMAWGRPGSPTSPGTRHPGLVSAIDVAPTILRHLTVHVPQAMRGDAMEPGAG